MEEGEQLDDFLISKVCDFSLSGAGVMLTLIWIIYYTDLIIHLILLLSLYYLILNIAVYI